MLMGQTNLNLTITDLNELITVVNSWYTVPPRSKYKWFAGSLRKCSLSMVEYSRGAAGGAT